MKNIFLTIFLTDLNNGPEWSSNFEKVMILTAFFCRAIIGFSEELYVFPHIIAHKSRKDK